MASCRNDAVSTAPAGNYESGLKAGAVTDAAGRQIMPKGVVSTGSAGPHHPRRPVPSHGWR